MCSDNTPGQLPLFLEDLKLIRKKSFAEKTGFKDKKLWDLLAVFTIPIVVALATGAFGLLQTHLADLQHQADQQRATDQQQATTLQTYLDKMQDLLLNQNLLKSEPIDAPALLARARTLATLRELDPTRKGILLEFLWENRLIGYPVFDAGGTFRQILPSRISLTLADLSHVDLRGGFLNGVILYGANLSGGELGCTDPANARTCTDLEGADLRVVNFQSADLNGALLGCFPASCLGSTMLQGANLQEANLQGAQLQGADLSCLDPNNLINRFCTDLRGAKLQNAHLGCYYTYCPMTLLSGANMQGAILDGADLSQTNVAQWQIDQVESCKNTRLPKSIICRH